jgi:hypothetical protein
VLLGNGWERAQMMGFQQWAGWKWKAGGRAAGGLLAAPPGTTGKGARIP